MFLYIKRVFIIIISALRGYLYLGKGDFIKREYVTKTEKGRKCNKEHVVRHYNWD